MLEFLYSVRCFLDRQELLDSLVSLTDLLNHRVCYCKLIQRLRETWSGWLEMNKTHGLSVINSLQYEDFRGGSTLGFVAATKNMLKRLLPLFRERAWYQTSQMVH